MSQFGSGEDSNRRMRDLLNALACRFTYSDAACEVIVERALRRLIAEAEPIQANSKTLLPIVRRVALDYFGIERDPDAVSTSGRPTG